MTEIEKNVEIPEPWRRKKGEELPYDKLEVGDSFVLKKNGHKSWGFAFASIQIAQKTHNITLTTRLVDDETRRIWRTA